jgi:hypothetical protein
MDEEQRQAGWLGITQSRQTLFLKLEFFHPNVLACLPSKHRMAELNRALSS